MSRSDDLNVLIRPAVPEDADGLSRVRVLTWQAAYRGIIPDDILDNMNLAEETSLWRQRLATITSERSVYIAEVVVSEGSQADADRLVVGFGICGPERESDPEYTGELYALYVLPEYQGQGIGRRLLQTAAEWLKEHGYERMLVYVLRDNYPSRRFYEALGGKPVREVSREERGVNLVEVGYGYELGSAA